MMKYHNAVTVHELNPSVACITMKDTSSKNGFTPQLVDGLIEAFELVSNNESYRAVILTGYESFFSSGGTKEALLAIQNGEIKFSDTNIYRLPLDCPIPVISAMQGHAIGGGFILGLYADFVVLSEESIYCTNFMRYGFTPGLGATRILPLKLGFAVSQEMLMLANNYWGRDLKEKGIPYPVVPRDQVMERAQSIAADLCEKPRRALRALKENMCSELREQVSCSVDNEIRMHEMTFHHQEVKDRIEELYGN